MFFFFSLSSFVLYLLSFFHPVPRGHQGDPQWPLLPRHARARGPRGRRARQRPDGLRPHRDDHLHRRRHQPGHHAEGAHPGRGERADHRARRRAPGRPAPGGGRRVYPGMYVDKQLAERFKLFFWSKMMRKAGSLRVLRAIFYPISHRRNYRITALFVYRGNATIPVFSGVPDEDGDG